MQYIFDFHMLVSEK